MNKKALALIIAGLVILAAIVYFIFFYDFSGQEQITPPPPPTTAEPVVSKSTPTTPLSGVSRTEGEKSRDEANQLAIFFADRYGSSSNQADFSNLVDLGVFMTDAFKAKTNAYIASERAKTSSEIEYEGVTTKAVIAEFVTFNDVSGTATGTVKTKRQETKADGSTNSYDQDLSITLKKVGSEWKVDSADWK